MSLPLDDYRALRRLVDEHTPPLRLNYAIQFAVHLLLERGRDPQMLLRFGDPMPRSKNEG